MNKINILKKSISAGMLISIGSVVKLQCSNQIVGAILFSIGLFFICSFNMYLFTGKIAYINKNNWHDYPVIWLGNLIGCILSAILIRLANPNITDISEKIINQKFCINIFSVSILAFFCGMIMYLSVDNYKSSNSDISKVFGIVIGVTVFLLCGFEHSIADMSYISLGIKDINDIPYSALFLITVSLFNAIGSLFIKYLLTTRCRRNK